MNEIIEVKAVDTSKAMEGKQSAEQLWDKAELVSINTQEELNNAVALMKEVRKKYKDLDTERKKLKVPVDTAAKAIQALFKPILENLLDAENIIKNDIGAYQEKQEKIRKEQEEKLRRQAAAEEERKKRALEERAKKAEEKGNLAKAEELRDKKDDVNIQAPTIAGPEKTAGICTVTRYTGRVVNFKLLPDPYKLVNQSAINAVGQQTKGAQAIPGVVWEREETVRNR
jgi:DNA repair exonuclease SbcCD ATPase subunit